MDGGRHGRSPWRPSARPRPTTTPTRRAGARARPRARRRSTTCRGCRTTSDEAGRQIRAGLELWVGKDDDYPLRGVGEVAGRLDARARRAAPRRRVLRLAHRGPHRRSAATTSSAARDQGGRHGLRRRHHAAADRGVHPRARGARHPGRGPRHGDGAIAAERARRAAAVDARARPDHRGASSSASSAAASTRCSATPVDLDGYGARLMGELEPNAPLLDYYRAPARRARPPARDAAPTTSASGSRAGASASRSTSCSSCRRLGLRGHPQAGAGDLRARTLERLGPRRRRRAPSSTTSRSTSPPPARRACTPIHFRDTAQASRRLGRASSRA